MATTRTSAVVTAAAGVHITDWLRDWAQQIVAETTVTRRWAADRRTPGGYTHPADDLLGHVRRFGAPDLAALLGWSVDDIERHRQHVARCKDAAAAAHIADERARAPELATPKLTDMKKAELLALADTHGIAVKKSATNPVLIAAILGSQAACEAVIGLV